MSKRGNGEGSIYFSEKLNRWIGQYTAGRKADGSLNRKSVYGNTRKEVKDKLQKKLEDISKGINVDKCDITVYELGSEIIETKFKANKIKGTSYKTMSYSLNKIKNSNIASLKIQKIMFNDIQEFLYTITSLSNSYIEKIVITLNLIFNEAINRDYIYKNPMRNVVIPKSNVNTKIVQALTVEQQKELLKLINGHKYEDLFKIGMFTGLRCGEILALTPENIDLEKNIIHIIKTVSRDENNKVIISTVKTEGSVRDIPITDLFKDNLINALNNMKENENNLIFTSRNKAIITVSTIDSYLTRLAIKNNFEVSNLSSHILRHTYATRCIENGMPAEVLQKLLGHKNITTTINTYTTIFDAFRNDVVKNSMNNIALKLDIKI